MIGLSYDEVTAGPQPVAPSSMSRFGVQRLYRDAGAMAVSSVANAVLGIVFWAFAARLFAPEQLGVMTAVLAVITSAGLVAASGVGDAYAALLPSAGAYRARLYARGQRIFYILALTLGIGAAIGTTLLLAEVRGSIGVALLVVVGIAAWAGITLQNATLVALGRANWLPATNIAASLGKITLLPLLAVTLQWHSVELAVVVAAAAVVVVLQPFVGRMIRAQHDSTNAEVPEERLARSFNAFVSQTIFAAVLGLGAITLTPFVVTAFAGPRQGALFALALSVVQALDFIGAALAASLSVHASGAPDHAGSMAKGALLRALALEAIGAVVIIALAPLGLQVLNSQYGAMNPTEVIAILCGASLMRAAYLIWAGLERARRNVTVPLVLNCVFTAILLLATPVMSARFGALGGASAVLLAQSVLTLGAAFHVLSRQLKLRRWAKAQS